MRRVTAVRHFRSMTRRKHICIIILSIILVYILFNVNRHTDNRESLDDHHLSFRTGGPISPRHALSKVPIIHRMNGFEIKPRTESLNTGEHQCIIKHGSNTVNGADLSLFSELDVRHYKTPPTKAPGSLWAFYSKEAQIIITNPLLQKKWDGMFNYSATFVGDSAASYHIFRAKLMPLSPSMDHYFTPNPKMRHVRALWFVTHCTRKLMKRRIYSARESYVFELSKYITIDVYTSPDQKDCRHTLGNLIRDDTNEPVMADYMFYLAFENNLCKDYITEKFWKVLESNSTTIPVALGGQSIEDYEAVAPPNSFIHVRNFTSPEALANHLKHVAQDDNAFHYYNQWRNEYWLKTKHVYNKGSKYLYHGDFFSYLCKLAHERPHNIWHTFSTDYGKHQCLDVSEPEVHCSYYNLSCKT